jgi:hypothetical protein
MVKVGKNFKLPAKYLRLFLFYFYLFVLASGYPDP